MYNIVICDDENMFVSEIRKNLEQYAHTKGVDFRFQIYYDGKDLLDNYRDDFDLIFMDIKMEKVDGLKAAGEIRRCDKTVGLIFLTSIAEYVWKGYEFGAINYLLKPITYGSLEMELDRFFASYPGKEERFLIVANDAGKFKVPVNNCVTLKQKEEMYCCTMKNSILLFIKV